MTSVQIADVAALLASRSNPDDRRDDREVAFMSGTLPPKVPIFTQAYKDALAQVLADTEAVNLIGAHQFRGADIDRLAGAEFAGRRMPQRPDPERVVVTNGTHSALIMLMSGLVPRGGVLAVEELSYAPVKVYADMLGITVLPVTMDHEGLLPEALTQACKQHRPAALYTMPTLHNPTTAVMSEQRREEITDVCREFGLFIIEDDIYSVLPHHAPPPLSTYLPEQSWYILGTAKGIAAGLKIAYVVGPSREKTGRLFWPGVRATFWMCAPISGAVTSRLILSGHVNEIVTAVRAEIASRQALVPAAFGDADLRTDPAAPHVWLRLPESTPRQAFVAEVRRRGVDIGASDQFVLTDAKAPNAVRFGLGGPPREVFEPALQTIADVYHAGWSPKRRPAP